MFRVALIALQEERSVHPIHGNPRTGLLRTFLEPDWVLRSPFRALCVQGALNCPLKHGQEMSSKPLPATSQLGRQTGPEVLMLF